MKQKIHYTLRDSASARWTALILIASMMFFAYMFVDVLAPLQNALAKAPYGWSEATYGTFSGSEYFLNVFVFFLIFAGIILDKIGVRFTALLATSVMIAGAAIKFYALTPAFEVTAFYNWLGSWWVTFPATAKLASLGFMIFGCGVEMAGITASKAIVKWFKGKELAMAMGIELAIARLGVFAVFRLSPWLESIIEPSVLRPVGICGLLLCVGFLSMVIYFFMDRKLERQMGEAATEPEEPFKVSDIGKLFTNKAFLLIAALCVIYYSAIFPFQKFATGMLENRLGVPTAEAAGIFSWFPIGAMILTPLLGAFLDRKGKGATMLMIGAVLMTLCHLTFALFPLSSSTVWVAYIAIIVLGVSFSLVPAALWPSVPKLVEDRYLGSSYSVIFWIQNIGLLAFPIIIGNALRASNPGVAETLAAGGEAVYNYTVPMLIFASLGVFAFFMAIWLKAEDRKKGYGLECPNIQK